MRQAESEILRALERGERQFDWYAWFGEVETAEYLTEAGRALTSRMSSELTAFFGPKWLPKATTPGESTQIEELGAASPLLGLSQWHQRAAWVETLRWWASIQIHEVQATEGLDAVRRPLRSNFTGNRLRHSLAQLRIGAVGLSVGAKVVLEPSKTRGPGDVSVQIGDSELFLEVVTDLPRPNPDEAAVDRHAFYLLSRQGELHWHGDVPGHLSPADERLWQDQIQAAATRCLTEVEPVKVVGPWGRLTALPGRTAENTRLTGRVTMTDLGSRMLGKIDDKAAQTRDAGIAWIWVEDVGGMHVTTEFVSMALDAKLHALSALVGPALGNRTHVGGVVWSRAIATRQPVAQRADGRHGYAVQQVLSDDRVRQSVVVAGRLIFPHQLQLLRTLLDREAGWLDWALSKLGAGRLSDLLA